MAKFAQVGYGSDGRGSGKDEQGYTYLVSDNVRTGDTIHPAVKHWKNGNIFGTTGKVLSQTKETTEKAQQIKDELDKKGQDINEYKTGKELGVERKRNATGQFSQDRQTQGIYGSKNQQSYYANQVRARNIEALQQVSGNQISQGKQTQNALGVASQIQTRKSMRSGDFTPDTQQQVETYDSYTSSFMKGEK